MIRWFLRLVSMMAMVYMLGYVAAGLAIIFGVIYLIKKVIDSINNKNRR